MWPRPEPQGAAPLVVVEEVEPLEAEGGEEVLTSCGVDRVVFIAMVGGLIQVVQEVMALHQPNCSFAICPTTLTHHHLRASSQKPMTYSFLRIRRLGNQEGM